jgi:DNA polymerase III epsilon subunit-like protein
VKTAILFDCEYLCLKGSQSRFWCAAHDPDPVIAHIGAVKLGLEGDFPILDTFKAYIRPMDRFGNQYGLDPFFTELTGVTEGDIETQGVALEEALKSFDAFSGGARFWSWGKDELNALAISCYISGIQPPIPAHRFDNAVKLVVIAGMPIEDLEKMRSNKLADYYGIEHPPLKSHDALDDAFNVAYAVQHLLRTGKITPAHLDQARPRAQASSSPSGI